MYECINSEHEHSPASKKLLRSVKFAIIILQTHYPVLFQSPNMDKNPSDFTGERNNAGFYDALVIWEDRSQQKNNKL